MAEFSDRHGQPIEMHAGAVIDYKLRVRGFPIRWRSEITEWEPPYHFVDEQIRGPYRLWIIRTSLNREMEARLCAMMCGTLFRSIGSCTNCCAPRRGTHLRLQSGLPAEAIRQCLKGYCVAFTARVTRLSDRPSLREAPERSWRGLRLRAAPQRCQ